MQSMHVVRLILAILFELVGFGCSIFVLVEAFRDEIWKGFLALLCGFYWLYFAIFEWEHEYKIPILLGALAGSAAAAGIMQMG